jgi:hypothetical protein
MIGRISKVIGMELNYSLTCLQYQVKHAGEPGHKLLVNGSPKTGTTWMVKMLRSLPKYHDLGNFQRDIERYRTAPSHCVIHGHEPFSQELWEILQEASVQVLLMIRDPRDQAVSRVYHIRRDVGHEWHERLTALTDDEALALCLEGRPGLPSIAEMVKLTSSWLDVQGATCTVKYEQLLERPRAEMQRVLRVLDIGVDDSLLDAIIQRNTFERLSVGRKIWANGRRPGSEDTNSHFRKGISGDWQNHFKPVHTALVKNMIGDVLIKWGYERDLNW